MCVVSSHECCKCNGIQTITINFDHLKLFAVTIIDTYRQQQQQCNVFNFFFHYILTVTSFDEFDDSPRKPKV